MSVQTLPPQDVNRRLRLQGGAHQFIDVRTAGEYASVHADGARNIPLDQLDARSVVAAAPAGAPIYLICGSGARSAKACEALASAGFDNAVSVAGGTTAWQRAGLPVILGVAGATISLERQVRIAAGSLVLVGVSLGVLLHPAWLALAGFVGAGLVYAGLSDTCGMGLFLSRMPWNCSGSSPTGSCTPAARP